MGSGGDRQVPLADRERVEQVSARMSWTSPEEPSGEGSRSGRTRPPGAVGRAMTNAYSNRPCSYQHPVRTTIRAVTVAAA
jgi:hypothetical protein